MITVKTEELKRLAAKALKGTSITPAMPVCACVNVKQTKGVFSLVTINEAGYYMENKMQAEGKDFNVIVNAAQFTGLIQKLTSDEAKIEQVGNTHLLLTSGGGKFKFELVYDIDGSDLVFPKNPIKQDKKNQKKFKVAALKSVFDLLNCAINKVTVQECYSGFFFNGKEAVTTDGRQLVSTKSDLYTKKAILPKALVELALLNDAEDFILDRTPGNATFISDNFLLAGKTPAEDVVNTFPSDKVTELFSLKMPGEVILAKDDLLKIIDRISLFTVGEVLPRVLFTLDKKDGMILSAQNTKGVEKVTNEGDKKKFIEFTGALPLETLRGLLNANPDAKINLNYGVNKAVKMTFGDTVQVLSLVAHKES